MASITQNKQKCLIFTVVSRGSKKLIRLEQKEEYSTSKKKNSSGINYNKNNDNNNKNVILILISM